MRTNRWIDWCIAKGRIADELKEYYQACTTEESPPRLLTLSKSSVKNSSKSKNNSAVA
jgi:hypothetical protein